VLTKLLPDQVARFWDVIKYAIEQSLPPIVTDSPEKMNRVLSSCLMGQAEVWASYVREEEKIKFNGIAITRIIVDDISMTKNLLLYSVYGYEEFNNSTWIEGIKSLAEYAKAMHCSQIIAYSNIEGISTVVKKLGGTSSYFLSFDINKIIQNLDGLRR
jgi:hypothetical protein